MQVESISVPWANHPAALDNSLPQRPSLMRTRAIEHGDAATHMGHAQSPALNGKLGNLTLSGQFSNGTDANKLRHDRHSWDGGSEPACAFSIKEKLRPRRKLK
jgi:hypothetical protein